MRLRLVLPLILATCALLLGPMGCTGSNWCADCDKSTKILALNYQPNNTYAVGVPIAVNPPNPAGGTPVTYAILTGSLPAGLSLDPRTGNITGTPTTPGVYTLTIQGTNASNSASQTITITVVPNVPLALSYATPQVFPASSAIATQPGTLTQATPGIATTFAVTSGSLPAGLSLNGTTGDITGTPTTPGVSTFTITATNGTRTATATATYTVTPTGSLGLNYATPLTFTAGSAISTQTPSVTNPTPGVPTTFAVTSGSLPAGLTLNADGTITGTPTVPGVYPFTVTATNGTRTATSSPTYTVTPSSPLSLSYVTPQTFTQGTVISTQSPTLGNATPGVSTTYAVTGGSLPAGLTLNASTGAITGTPTTPGVYAFTIAATNGTRTATANATYTVVPSAALTVSYTSPQTFTAGTGITAQSPILGNATPGVSTTYAVTSGSLPTGLSLDPSTGAITGTPTVPGVYAFTITATNGSRTATSSPTYIVTPAAALGVSYATPQTFTQGTAIATQTPSVTNPTPGLTTTFAVTSGSLPAGLTLNADGTITGTPTVPGVYAFTVTATNGARTATSNLTYTVESSATLSLSYASPQTFAPNVAIIAQSPTVGNATPGVTTTYAVTSGSLPPGLTLNADGTITGTPTVSGVYAFTVTATNGSRTANANVSYTVLAAPTALNYASPVTYTSGVAISPNNPNPTGGAPSSYTITSGSLPAGLSVNPTTGVITGTPTASGSFSVTIQGSNGAGSASQTVSITVLPPVTASLSANPTTVPVGQSSSLTPLFSGGAGVINNGIGSVASGGGLPVGVFNSVGTYTYTLTVTNSQGVTATATATITVVATPSNSVTLTVPTTGTSYTNNTPGDPLKGLSVVVPNQGSAVCAATSLTISRGVGLPQPGAFGGGATAVSDPWTFSSTVGYPFRQPMTVTLPYDGSGLSGSDLPVPFYWEPAYGQWVALGLKSVDTTNNLVTFTTLLPGQYTVAAIPGLSTALTTQSTGLSSGTDSWFQPNQGVYDIPGGSALGMSSFASWYFSFKKASNGNAGLYTQLKEGNLTSTADDISAHALINRLANATQETWGTLWTQGAYSLSDVQTGLAFITALRVTGQPQIMVMGEARPAVSNAMATVVYAFDSATNKFSVLDPNFPGMPLTLTWNPSTGAFTAYDRSSSYVPTFTKYALEGQPSVHRLTDYERAFDGATSAFPNPPFATLAVSDVSGTGAITTGGLAAVPSATNVTITGTVSNGSDTATHIFWSQNGGARTPVALSGNAFTFTIPALSDPYNTIITLETTANPCDPTFSYTGYTEFTVKEAGRTAWFPNICFESGSTNPWVLEQGSNSGIFYPSPITWTGSGQLSGFPITWNAGSIDSALVTVGNDANVPSIPRVYDGVNAFRVNDPTNGAHISRIYQSITIPTDVTVPKMEFYWAAVMQSAGHAPSQQPFVDIVVQDVDNGYEIVYYKHFYANDPSYPGWIAGNGTGTNQWFGINWQKVALTNLSARKGHQLRIMVMAADCTQNGHGGYAYLDGVNCN